MTSLLMVDQALQTYSMLMIGFALSMLVFTMVIEFKRS